MIRRHRAAARNALLKTTYNRSGYRNGDFNLERRAWARQAVELPALYEAPSIEPQPCWLRDYCLGGMLIDSETDLAELLSLGSEIYLSVSMRVGGVVTPLRLHGIVRRINGQQIGIQFSQDLDPAAQQAFEAAALQYRHALTQRPRATIPGAQRIAVVSSILDSFDSWWPPLFVQLRPQLDHALTIAASSAKTNQEIDAYFDAMNVLRKNSARLSQTFVEEFRRQVRKPEEIEVVHRTPEAKLSLVDKSEFEDWLLRSSVCGRIEAQHAHALTPLRDGLSVVYGLPIGADNNPTGPRVLTSLFMKVFRNAFTSDAVRNVVFEQFGHAVSASLSQFLQPVAAKLEQTGINKLVKAQADAPRRRELATRPRTKPQGHGGAPVQRLAQIDTRALTPAPVAPQPARDLKTLSSLYRLREATPHTDAGGTAAPQHSIEGLLEALGELLEREADDAGSLAQLVAGRFPAESAGAPLIPPEQRLAIDVTDAVFGEIFDDNRVAPELRQELGKLRMPLLKTMLRDPSFMDDRKHPARQLVNQFVRLSAQEGLGARGLRKTLVEYLQRINQEFDGNPAVVTEVLTHLNELVEMQSQVFLRNLQRVQEARQGQEKLQRARWRVARELMAVTGGRRVSVIFKRLIEESWRNLLVLMLLKHGDESIQWQAYALVPRQLMMLLRSFKRSKKDGSSADFAARLEALLEPLARGLAESGEDPDESRRRTAQIRHLLLGQLDATTSEALLALDHLDPELLDTGDVSPARPGAIDRSEAARASWLRKVRRMESGEGVILSPGTAAEERLTLAWRAEDASSLVFVNERGLEARRYRCEELMTELAAKDAIVVPGEVMSAVDRGVLAMIQKVYQEVADEAARDERTGMYNRRKFESLLERALSQTRQEDTTEVLCYLDLDQFAMLNASYGPEAGNRLLCVAAEALQGFAEGKQVTPGYLGGSEFGILLSGCGIDAAMPRIRRYREAIARASFPWNGDVISMSASWALVEINARSESVNSLLKAAYHACAVAKGVGRNRVQVYAEANAEISRRTAVLEWTSRIGRSLERNDFRLRVQKIAPLRPDDSHEHNEVLLSIVMNGQPHPVPAELIHAAESYGLITRIDRWVVQESLRWMAENPHILERIGGLAVNLSGASLTDPQFVDFVMEAIVNSGVDTSKLCFEVTETSMISNLDEASDLITEVKRLGCTFALDDFGSGMSSYAYLKNMPVDYLKIDGAFIRDISNSPADYAMVKSINEIGHFLGKKTIAEFVESEEIIQTLNEIGVDYAQGYAIERPYYISELGI